MVLVWNAPTEVYIVLCTVLVLCNLLPSEAVY